MARVDGKDALRMSVQINQRMDRAVTKTCQEMSNRVTARTPVDTGALRRSWIPGVSDSADSSGEPLFTYNSNAEQSVAISNSSEEAVGKVFTLTNKQEYAEKIEMGSSRQAPEGMLRVTLQEFASIANANINKEKR
jgi:hypothetical protein